MEPERVHILAVRRAAVVAARVLAAVGRLPSAAMPALRQLFPSLPGHPLPIILIQHHNPRLRLLAV